MNWRESHTLAILVVRHVKDLSSTVVFHAQLTHLTMQLKEFAPRIHHSVSKIAWLVSVKFRLFFLILRLNNQFLYIVPKRILPQSCQSKSRERIMRISLRHWFLSRLSTCLQNMLFTLCNMPTNSVYLSKLCRTKITLQFSMSGLVSIRNLLLRS